MSSIANVQNGFAFKSKDFVDSGFPVIRIKNIGEDRTVDVTDVQFIPEKIGLNSERFWLHTGDIIMAMTGNTGRFGLLVNHKGVVCLQNQRVAKIIPNTEGINTTWFSYCFLNQKSTMDYVYSVSHGSVQKNISTNSIMLAPLLKPSDILFTLFNEKVECFFSKIITNREQEFNLINLRDTLLPKLMSGELCIADAEKIVEDV